MKNLIILLSMLFVLNAYSQSYNEILLRKHISEFKTHEKQCNDVMSMMDTLTPDLPPAPFPVCRCLGVELLECGNFECSNNWTTTGAWAIVGGVARQSFGGSGMNRLSYQFTKPLLKGYCYQLEFDVLNYVAQDFVIGFNDPPQLTFPGLIVGSGHYVYSVNLTGLNNVYEMIFEAIFQTELSIKNVSLIPCCCN